MTKSFEASVLGIMMAVNLGACAAGDELEDELGVEVGFRDGSATLTNPRPPTLGNGLEQVAVSGVDVGYALSTPQGLSETQGLLADPDPSGLETARYIVECALPAGDSVTKTVNGQPVDLHGLVGMAPEWKDGACDQDCQEWVSACILARVNVTGQTVFVALTAEHPNVGHLELDGFGIAEAGWFGNVFLPEPEMYLCHGTNDALAIAYEEGRTCSTGQHEDCGLTLMGQCKDNTLCDKQGSTPVDCEANGKTWHTLATAIEMPEGWNGW